jgi:hypothetical protein
MPHGHTVSRHIVQTVVTGKPRPGDIRARIEAALSDPLTSPERLLIDASGAELAFGDAEIRQAAERLGALGHLRCAVVVSDGASFSLAELFAAYASWHHVEVGVFNAAGSAVRWLEGVEEH